MVSHSKMTILGDPVNRCRCLYAIVVKESTEELDRARPATWPARLPIIVRGGRVEQQLHPKFEQAHTSEQGSVALTARDAHTSEQALPPLLTVPLRGIMAFTSVEAASVRNFSRE